MNLEAAPIKFEVEFRFELAEDFEADVTEGANEVGVHLDFERHGVTSIKRYNGGARGVKSARACEDDKITETEHLYLAHLAQLAELVSSARKLNEESKSAHLADSLARLASSPSVEVSGFPLGLTLALLGWWFCESQS